MNDHSSKWWEQDPARFLNEYQAMDKLKQNNRILKDIIWQNKSGQMTIEGKIPVRDKIRHFELIYPFFYPSECPAVYPMNRKERWSKEHQFNDGALCLEFGPDNWHSSYTASDVIQSLINLLQGEISIETPTGIVVGTVPSRHKESLGFALRNEFFRLLVTESLRSACKDSTGNGKWKSRFITTAKSCCILPLEFPVGHNISGVAPEVFSKSNGIGFSNEGIFFALRVPGKIVRLVRNLDDCNTLLREFAEPPIVIGESEGYGKADFRNHIPILLISNDGHLQCIVIGESEGRLIANPIKSIDVSFEYLHDRIPDEIRNGMAGKKIGIIGLGSVGSKIAVSLARSGLENFVLVDEDILLPENISRHQSDLQGIGTHKVSIIAQSIRQVSHNARIEEHIKKVGGQTNPLVHIELLDKLRECDTIIDCTANSNAFLILAMICNQAKIPLVWGEVFGGGLGGIIASCIPVEDPCPLCVRRAMWNQLAKYPTAPGVTTVDYTLEIEEQPPMVALDADVSFTASIMTQRAIYCLVKNESFSNAPQILLFSLRKGWIFKRPYEMIHISARKDDWHCELCWQGIPKNESLSGKEKEHYRKIMQSIHKSQDNC